MLINLSKFLSSQDISYNLVQSYTIDDEEFIEKTHLNKTVDLILNFFKVEDSVILTGIVKYFYDEHCARCLTEFENKVEAKFEAVVVDNLSIDEDNESDEIQLVIEDGCVNLDEAIKQTIYLSMPMKSLCKDDCKGICPTCGVNLNNESCNCENNLTDPRLEKLKDLLKD